MTVDLSEDWRRVLLKSLANFSIDRPELDCGRCAAIAETLYGLELFEVFRERRRFEIKWKEECARLTA